MTQLKSNPSLKTPARTLILLETLAEDRIHVDSAQWRAARKGTMVQTRTIAGRLVSSLPECFRPHGPLEVCRRDIRRVLDEIPLQTVEGTILMKVTPGANRDCPNCQEAVGLEGPWKQGDTATAQKAAEPHYSAFRCDLCESNLPGLRHPVHGFNPEGELIHAEACVNCMREL